MMKGIKGEKSSFRDNSGFVYKQAGIVYRQVNDVYRENYDYLLSSGLYNELIQNRLLIPHEEVQVSVEGNCYKTLKPSQLPFVSYPYSWSFSMLKDAALLTLEVQKKALEYGMILKDASVYNIQFMDGKPIFIDTLSFEKFDGMGQWRAYGQFCRHFLAPLALMDYVDISLNQLLITNLDGIPLELATRLMPIKAKFNLGLYIHLFLHSKSQQKFQKNVQTIREQEVLKKGQKESVLRIINHLDSTINSLSWTPKDTVWDAYYDKWVEEKYLKQKFEAVTNLLTEIGQAKVLLDLGANDGTFSMLSSKYYEQILSFDIDPACVEQNYNLLKKENKLGVLPLVIDFTNPAPAIGWNNEERQSVLSHIGKVDSILALAVIHHLCIGKNIPLTFLAEFFSQHCENLIIEFVPKSDEKVRMLLQHREDIFDLYTLDSFVSFFSDYFDIVKQTVLVPTERVLFLMKVKNV